jgi:hypothetical protein
MDGSLSDIVFITNLEIKVKKDLKKVTYSGEFKQKK